MDQIISPIPQHERSTKWAREQNIRITGVGPAQVSGRGFGVIAQRRIEVGEELVKVPASALLTINSISKGFRLAHEGITVHGLLASFLAFGASELSPYTLWRETWPSQQDLEETMPILWLSKWKASSIHQSNGTVFPNQLWVLPPAIGGCWSSRKNLWRTDSSLGILCQQEKKLRKDWAIVSKVFPGETMEKYRYYWLLVNTRSFYYELPGVKCHQARDDCMALCPFVDYFNHQDHGCDVTFDAEGYTVTSDRVYEIGQEIFVSYGNHSNDFLLVEYGFILEENKWDSLPIDDLVFHHSIDKSTRNRLETAGYLGDYTLSREGVCHRTQVAIRTQTLGISEWKKFVEGRDGADMGDERRADAYIVTHIMDIYYSEAVNVLRCLEKITDLGPEPRKILVKRWSQIKRLIMDAFNQNANLRAETGSTLLSETLNEEN